MIPSMLAMNITKQHEKINKVGKQKEASVKVISLEKNEKEISKSVKKVEVIHSDSWVDSWWDDNMVWLSM